jgi:hypothetical protein
MDSQKPRTSEKPWLGLCPIYPSEPAVMKSVVADDQDPFNKSSCHRQMEAGVSRIKEQLLLWPLLFSVLSNSPCMRASSSLVQFGIVLPKLIGPLGRSSRNSPIVSSRCVFSTPPSTITQRHIGDGSKGSKYHILILWRWLHRPSMTYTDLR